MSKTLKTLVATGILVSVALPVSKFAIGHEINLEGATPEQVAAFEDRHEYMNNLGKAMKAFSNYLKRGSGEPMELASMAGEIAETASSIPELFPEGTGVAEFEDSEAKPEIWTNWDEFVSAADAMAPLAGNLQEAFDSGDKGQIAAGVKALGGKGCRGCHKKFRLKKE